MGKISKKTFSFCSIFILFSSVLAENSIKLTSFSENKSHTPHWEPLCDKGHQYLFSEETVDWSSALEMCQLLGGYLVRIENQHENNCLLVHAMKNELHSWWWTSSETKNYINTINQLITLHLNINVKFLPLILLLINCV